MRKTVFVLFLGSVLLFSLGAASAQGGDETLVIYSGRSQSLIEPILSRFAEDTGIAIKVRYAKTTELAATILEEGAASPADVFLAQDAGALGALAHAEMLAPLPSDILERVGPRFQSPDGLWVGVSGRARVLVYNTELVSPVELPASILDLTGEEWHGRVGWAPTNASFQANVTAMRVLLGEEATEAWLRGMIANDVLVYPKNTPIVQAAIDGEIAVGLVNHYYLFRFLAEDADIDATLHFFPNGDAGSPHQRRRRRYTEHQLPTGPGAALHIIPARRRRSTLLRRRNLRISARRWCRTLRRSPATRRNRRAGY